MKARIVNAVFVLGFMLMLLVPLAFVNPKGGEVSERENRFFAARPPLSDALKNTESFIRQFDEWLADNIGFRQDFINYFNKVKKMENNVQNRDGQYVMLNGEQGHRFFAHADGWMIGKFQGKPFLSDDNLQGMAAGLSRAKKFLDEKGIPLVVMFCTDKETIYPEFYPKSIARGKEPGHLDSITDYLKTHTDVDVFNIKEALMSRKKEYFLYNKTANDLSHYNEVGAFFSYRELMRHVNAYFPEIRAFTLDDIEIWHLPESAYPDPLKARLKRDTTFRRLEDSFFDDLMLKRDDQGMAYGNNDDTLPTILILRDSYMGWDDFFLMKYIPEHFGKTILFHFTSLNNLEKYVTHFEPDIVVFEAVERELKRFAESAETILQ